MFVLLFIVGWTGSEFIRLTIICGLFCALFLSVSNASPNRTPRRQGDR